MKLKEINRTAVQSWSPAQLRPVYMATGTFALQLDASFSTNAALEFFQFDLTETSLNMKKCGSLSSAHRFHKLIWTLFDADRPHGVVVTGDESGNVSLYDPGRIMAGKSDAAATVATSDRHTGAVRSLDGNPFQPNLLASGASQSEIYIWDLNNFDSPTTPGPKTQPLDDVTCVAWNRQVGHILASATPNGRAASVFDLRKNDTIIKVGDRGNKMQCSALAWHPNVATQMVLASEDDRSPVIQMWDLRFAASPLKVLERHTRGVLSVAWSSADPDLLLSCGKDGQILCWDPEAGEVQVLCESAAGSRWCFDVQWCPGNAAVFSAAAIDGQIGVYSIAGGIGRAQDEMHADRITKSFGNVDPFGLGLSLPPLPLAQTTAPAAPPTPLKKPPKWLRRPVGATFAFGGKLVTAQDSKPDVRAVRVSQVVTEAEFLERSERLQAALTSGEFAEFCRDKMSAAEDEFDRTVWCFLKANFEDDVRGRYRESLGFDKEELSQKISVALEAKQAETQTVDFISTTPAENLGVALELVPAADIQPEPEAEPGEPELEEDEGLCSEEEEARTPSPCENPDPEVDALIARALLTGDLANAIDLCFHDNRPADGILLAIAGGDDLLERAQRKYFGRARGAVRKVIGAVVMKEWRGIAERCDLASWREALAAILTHARPEEFSALCNLLGNRLATSDDPGLRRYASLCYIAAGNVEKLVSCRSPARIPLSLQDSVEKATVLRRAARSEGLLAGEEEEMSRYAALLAAQGSLEAAVRFLPENSERVSIQQLRHRLSLSLAPPTSNVAPPSLLPTPPVYQPARVATMVTSWSDQTPTALPDFNPEGKLPQAEPQKPVYAVAPPTSSTPAYMPSHQYQPSPKFPVEVPFYPQYSSSFFSPTPAIFPAFISGTPPSGDSFQHGGLGSPVSFAPAGLHPPSDGVSGPLIGWNDPPALNRAPKNKGVAVIYAPPLPITSPVLAPPCSDFAPPTLSPGPPGAPTGNCAAPAPQPVAKKPLPPEHLALKDIFEGLIKKCIAASNDPQTKRKLLEANKRLETLYDKLREESLSPAILGGLHDLARRTESRRYAEALSVHTHMVSSADFSQTSAFMPVLKVVLTQASRLGV